jgi:hypothetical protein
MTSAVSVEPIPTTGKVNCRVTDVVTPGCPAAEHAADAARAVDVKISLRIDMFSPLLISMLPACAGLSCRRRKRE